MLSNCESPINMPSIKSHRFVFIRHAEATCNLQDAHALISSVMPDSPLTTVGQQQAQLLANNIPKELIGNKIFSSPMIRAMQTANLLKTRHNLPLVSDERLEEVRIKPSLTPALSLSQWDTMLQERLNNPTINVRPEVETVAAQRTRVADFLCQRHQERGEEKVTVIVSHAFTIELAIFVLLGLDVSMLSQWRIRISNSALHIIENEEIGGKSRIVLTNAKNHLRLWL
ncbi:histidine phosphatase family protein [Xenorhabdus szentirmaii]|uniref:Phosphoglycerate mutase gpmB n=2 Tax=Xenorhabdus szentirmaii TaxID=290112 RepID=W1J4Y1_9GAMM|nr:MULTISPECIES: histidine phosphatase family protein [Xenorhabdus]MBD2799544.1 histidine phosphatase family protein [Xenorhabdus sp. M]MBD2803604.1 histidine phosphatase family protein [Xenorhabdus sp. ZM]MBD2822830.1 histidine phosphatase family protein [Xenorhabdus sp. 42]PHM34008.1 5''-phosphoribostamycin phosphatase [Xenorhabdus szentirmaii DSM 16338]CDL84500.1 putative phosphoglycerate mutase gpmB [Xenorhabdus szentirmaii DSM 16338]